MIKNKRQYTITKKKLEELKAEISELNSNNFSEVKRKLHFNGLNAIKFKLEAELRDYEFITNGDLKYFHSKRIEDLGKLLIQIRISKGYSQKEIASKLEMKEQQIQRYEKTYYSTISLEKLIEVVRALDVSIATERLRINSQEYELPSNTDKQNLSLFKKNTIASKQLFAVITN